MLIEGKTLEQSLLVMSVSLPELKASYEENYFLVSKAVGILQVVEVIQYVELFSGLQYSTLKMVANLY